MGSEGRKSILGVGECTAEVGGLRNLGKQNSWLHGQVVGDWKAPNAFGPLRQQLLRLLLALRPSLSPPRGSRWQN